MSGQSTELIAIYVAERGRLRRAIGRIIGDWFAAEDIVQDAYIKVSRAAFETRIDDQRGYLVRTATNLALDHRRRNRVLVPADADAELTAVADDTATPETICSDRQAVAIVAAAMDRLPARTRRAFEMHRLEQRTMAEIGVELGISTALVCKLVSEAYTALRDALRAKGITRPNRD